MTNLDQMLKELVARGASDLHITTGIPPMIRLHGQLKPLAETALTPAVTKQLAYSILTDVQKQKFEEQKELDFSFGPETMKRLMEEVQKELEALPL